MGFRGRQRRQGRGFVLLVALVLLAIVTSACTSAGSAAVGATDHAVASRFMTSMTRDYAVDYDPFPSTRDAIQAADVIVTGEITDITEGFAIYSPEGLWDQRTTLHVKVDEVIFGTIPNDYVLLEVSRSPLVPVHEIGSNRPEGQVLLILEDISDWIPFPNAVFEFPPDFDRSTAIYAPYPDGFWLSTDGPPVGYFASIEEMSERWPGVSDYASLTDALRMAAKGAN